MMTVAQLREALEDYGDHLIVEIETDDTARHAIEEVDAASVQDEDGDRASGAVIRVRPLR